MSSGSSGWPPGEAGGVGRGGYADDEFGAERERGAADVRHYPDDGGYDWSEPPPRPASQGDQYGRGRPDQYGQGSGGSSGRHASASSYGDSYRQDAYGQGSYDQGSYDQGSYGHDYGGWPAGASGYPGDQRGRDGYDQGGYGQGSYGEPGHGGSYGEPDYGRGDYGHDLGQGRYDRGSYARDDYGREGYSQNGYGADYYGQQSPGPTSPGMSSPGSSRYDPLSTDSYGRDLYAQEGYGSSARPGVPALGPGSDQEVTSGYRPDAGSFDSRDSGWFSQPADTGSFGRPDLGHPVASRAGEVNLPPGIGPDQEQVRAGGYDQWHAPADDPDGWEHDEPAQHEDDWQEDADGGLLSRRFGDGDGGGGGRRTGRRAARARRPRRLRGKFAVTAAVLAAALVLGAVADFGYERFRAWHTTRYGDYQGAGTGQVKFTVPPGAALSSLGPALVRAGVIMEVRPYDSAAAAAQNASHLQPGVYLLHHHMSAALAVTYLLAAGHRVNDQVTIIEGMRASAIAQALSKQTGIPVGQFTQIIEHPPASLGLPSWSGGHTAEGFLFPDTYTLLPKMTALHILQMMVTEFKQKVAAINLIGASQRGHTNPWHGLIVASLIQAEAGSVSDFGKISRVVWNRLLANMPLEFDSTVFYAMGKYGTYLKTQAQHNFPSPYNTYLHTGLPPGPIDNPGVAAMQAAVHATHGPWLYFITDLRHKPYLTYFTASHAQFVQWQQKFQG